MRSDEEKEIRAQLRSLKIRRDELDAQLAANKEARLLLGKERKKLVAKAEKIGIKFGAKAGA